MIVIAIAALSFVQVEKEDVAARLADAAQEAQRQRARADAAEAAATRAEQQLAAHRDASVPREQAQRFRLVFKWRHAVWRAVWHPCMATG